MPLFSSNSLVHTLISESKWTDLSAHLTKHPHSASSKDSSTNLPLHLAIKLNAPEQVISHLLNIYPASLKIKTSDGLTAIHHACMYNTDVNIIKSIFTAAPPDMELAKQIVEAKGTCEGWGAMHFAASFHQDPAIVAMLVERFADVVTIKDKAGHLPIHYCPQGDDSDKSKKQQQVKMAIFQAFPVVEYLDSPLVSALIAAFSLELSRGTGLKDKSLLTAWCAIVSYRGDGEEGSEDRFLPQIDELLERFPESLHILTKTKDATGRSPLESAAPKIFKLMTRHMLFCGRYVLGTVVHRGVNNVLVEAKDLQGSGDYKAIFSAFCDMHTEEERVRKEEEKKRAESGEEEEKELPPQSSPDSSPKLPKNKIYDALNLLGFGVSPTQFNTIFSKWDVNNDNEMDAGEFLELVKKDLDHNKPRNVVIKFMRDRSKFYNEITPRFECDLNSRYVMSLLKRFDETGSSDDDVR